MKKILSLTLAAALVLSLSACGGSSASSSGSASSGNAPAAAETQAAKAAVSDVELLAASSTVQNVGIAVADVITKKSGTIRMAATGTNSTEANIVQMLQKSDHKNTLYMASAAPYISAREGIGAFSEYEPTDKQKLVAAFMYGVNGFVTCDPEIKEVKDFDGKKVAMFADQLPQDMAKAAFEILGINVEIVTMTFSDQFTALSDGLVDACLYLGSGLPDGNPLVPVSPLQELCANKGGKVYGVTFPVDLQNQAVEKAGLASSWPYSPITVPVGSLSDSYNEEFDAYGSVTAMMCAWEDTDEQIVYDITKTVCENYESLGDYMTELKTITPSLMLSLLYMAQNENDIHPGALRYYTEAGLWPGEWEKANK